MQGCTESVSPIIGDERPYTVYGFLDPTTSQQFLRVFPVIEDFDEVNSVEIEAEVQTVDLATNERIVWTKQLVLFPDSTQGYVFTAQFTPVVAHTYRLEVDSPAGERSVAETTVPPIISIRRIESTSQVNPSFFIESDVLPNLVQADIIYQVVALQPSLSDRANFSLTVPVSYRGEESPASGGWQIRVNMFDDYEAVKSAFANICLTTDFISVRVVNFEFFIGDSNWIPPGGVFDRDLLIQPGSFSNVENGYGYFGSGYSKSFSISLTSSERASVGYALSSPCQLGPGVDLSAPECQDIEACL